MFQRIKASIDQALEQEQARTRAAQRSPSNAGTGARRVASRAISPTKGSNRPGSRNRQESLSRRDPAEFERAFTLDDGELSRSNTPQPALEQDGQPTEPSKAEQRTREIVPGGKGKEKDVVEAETTSELPSDIRIKLRKLDKLESRYQDLLRSYRIAHARVQTVDAFEIALRENTPLTTIADPNALVEYLNQTNLKGDLVLDELKRVSNERDSFKQRLDEAERRIKEAYDEAANLRLNKSGDSARPSTDNDRPDVPKEGSSDHEELTDGDPLGATKKSPPVEPKSPNIGLPRLSLFSPKLKSAPSPPPQESEDLFSYDNEIPRLEGEIRSKQEKIESLEKDVRNLRTDLTVTRESTQSMVSTLEEATREANVLREGKERSEADARERQDAYQWTTNKLRGDLKAAETRVEELERAASEDDKQSVRDLNKQLESTKSELQSVRDSKSQVEAKLEGMETLRQRILQLESELSTAQQAVASTKEEHRVALANLDACKKLLAVTEKQKLELAESAKNIALTEARQVKTTSNVGPVQTNEDVQESGGASKKNKKKKKKGSKAGAGVAAADATETQAESLKSAPVDDAGLSKQKENGDSSTEGLKMEIERLQQVLLDKEKTLNGLQGKLKDQEGLQEEIESLRDELVNVGQEHVEVKDKVKQLGQEKQLLEARILELEKELQDAHGAHTDATAGSDQRHNDLSLQFDDLKTKAAALQTDLSAAQQLASSRFRDLENLRASLQKAQPEINQLRIEAAELKTTKEALQRKDTELKKIEAKHEELRLEFTKLKQTVGSREAEIKTLSQLNAQESKNRSTAQEASNRATQDIARLEKEKRQAEDNLDRVSRELLKVREDLATHRSRLRDIEQQYNKHRSETEGIKEEMELKAAQYASAQSLMSSMRDQTSEMATQMKEARDRCESLDEEVAEAHRLLTERSREGETMRRLLADVEGRAESRIREMKDRMDTAIEERDKAEEEASTAGRRRAREIEDLRNKYHDIERSLKRAEIDKEELEYAQREWKKRREELEARAGQSNKDVDEVRRAMTDLRDALDDSEKQVRDLEKQRAELRRSVEETQHRIEKLQKSNKTLAEELGKVRESKKAIDSESQSSRTSLDSVPRLASPRPTTQPTSGREANGINGQSSKVDHAYLKNVLLQFLEQKDRKYQMQLLPVLAMLLQFDKKDEQRWMSAITARG